MPHPQLLVEDHPAGYRWLRLDRPERRNALDPGLMAAVRDALAAEPGTPAVLGSTDPQVFSAGADLTISDAERAVVSDLVYDCCQTIVTRPGPVIAVITGAAVGGGAQLAAAADFRIAGPGARLRWIGPPGLGLAVGPWVLPDLVGRGAALDITLTGRWVEAAEALALGLVHQVTDDPDAAGGQFAADLAARGTGAGVKSVMAAGGLLDRLRAEREANRAAWARVTGVGQRLPGHWRLPGVEPGRLAGTPAGDARRGVVRGRAERRYHPGAGRRVGRHHATSDRGHPGRCTPHPRRTGRRRGPGGRLADPPGAAR
ncbi:MAG: enoyl-CoA hydratase/isomerase family protein [Streptosporangiaceae bacterium]